MICDDINDTINNICVIVSIINHIFDGFLPTNTQTVIFPCEKTKELRRRERPGDLDYIEYEALRTIDNLSIGVKLLVVYSIVDPEKTLSMLNKDASFNGYSKFDQVNQNIPETAFTYSDASGVA